MNVDCISLTNLAILNIKAFCGDATYHVTFLEFDVASCFTINLQQVLQGYRSSLLVLRDVSDD